jgi:hypothetical protein
MNAIFSVFHKEYEVPRVKYIFPILVGNNKLSVKLRTKKEIFKDDTGNHISDLNPFFCELTAQYWIWKNFKQTENEIVGFAHYRRYLYKPTKPNKINNWFDMIIRNWFHFFYSRDRYFTYLRERKINSRSYFVNNQCAESLLKKYKIILPIPINIRDNQLITSVKTHYLHYHIQEDWEVMEKTLKTIHPDYSKTFDEFANGEKMCVYNMFITTRKVFDEYCNWLFPLLTEIYANMKISKDPYQQRVIGFMAERLLNVYFLHVFKCDEICYLPCELL